jgi:hypothetical protein
MKWKRKECIKSQPWPREESYAESGVIGNETVLEILQRRPWNVSRAAVQDNILE